MTTLILLGSTGSIGVQTLDLVRAPGSGLKVEGLAAHQSWERLLEQAREFGVKTIALSDPEAAEAARPHLPVGTTLFSGPQACEELIAATDFDTAIQAVVGCAGLPSTVAVIKKGKRVGLANKESLVVAGRHLMELARQHGSEIIPVDSEHSAVFQCLQGEQRSKVRKVLLTCSGGPLRSTPLENLASVTPDQALQHPTWSMGPRITVGSATLLNKAFEVIELHHLFDLTCEEIEVVVHPQSLVHSMVEFVDGAVMAHMGPPDMRGPIHYALHYPTRAPSPVAGFDVQTFRHLEFEAPDFQRFPALSLGYACIRMGEDSACVLNAADEIAVEGFLTGKIRFDQINDVHERVLAQRLGRDEDIESLLLADQRARAQALSAVQELSHINSGAQQSPPTTPLSS